MSSLGELQQLAGLLRAGLPTEHALELIGGSVNSPEVQTALDFSRRFGAALLPILDTVSDSLRAQEEHARAIDRAAAQPRATARLLAWLPPAALAICQLAGIPVVSALFGQPIALVSCALGAGLLWSAHRWMRHQIDRHSQVHTDGFLQLDLMAAAADSGLSPSWMRSQLAAELAPAARQLVDEALAFSIETGASVAGMLRLKAQKQRQQIRQGERIRVEGLGVKLVIPLGLAVLPAFVLMLVVPLALALG